MLEKSNGQPITKALVYGFYHKNNLGDDLFIEAFRHLFPFMEFTFVDYIDQENLASVSVVIFGGGSFLINEPVITHAAALDLPSKKIYYLGVGVEKDIHLFHRTLMKQAKLIAMRTPDHLEGIKKINPNTMYVPDLVYSLPFKPSAPRQENKILVVPNAIVVPDWGSPQWMHAAWHYFKSEFCQFLDYLVEENYQLRIFAMCKNENVSDVRAANELISGMKNRNSYLIDRPINNFESVTNLFSQCGLVITQRFHGIVLSEVTRTPYITLSHHDKFKTGDNKLSYYGLHKSQLIDSFVKTIHQNAKELDHKSIFAELQEMMKNEMQS